MKISEIHDHIITQLRVNAGTANPVLSASGYTGSPHQVYAVSTPVCRNVLKELVREQRNASVEEWLALMDVLMAGESHEEKTMAGRLLGYLPAARAELVPKRVEKWLGELVGWAEVDVLCQSNFSAEFLLARWAVWSDFLKRMTRDPKTEKRRASLVMLVSAVARSDEARLHQLAYENIEVLKSEKDILITKAISWLLRSMVDTQPGAVRVYVDANVKTLPKIAVRETQRKLETGRKN